jgi:hypothetical protein
MKELVFYVLLFTLGIAILIPALAITLCASAIVLVADELFRREIQRIINGRPRHTHRGRDAES